MIKFSDKTEKYKTKSLRGNSQGKGRFDLLPPTAISRVAKHFESGGKKYGDRNWEKGVPLNRYIDSTLRHLFQILDNQTDEDHEAAVVWNMLCFMETKEKIKKGKLPKSLNLK